MVACLAIYLGGYFALLCLPALLWVHMGSDFYLFGGLEFSSCIANVSIEQYEFTIAKCFMNQHVRFKCNELVRSRYFAIVIKKICESRSQPTRQGTVEKR